MTVFTKSAAFYDALYSWKDYQGEVEKLTAVIRSCVPDARTLLDVACGTGRDLELLSDGYRFEGLDLDAQLLAVARERLPSVPLHSGDMRDFELGRRFDVVTCLLPSGQPASMLSTTRRPDGPRTVLWGFQPPSTRDQIR